MKPTFAALFSTILTVLALTLVLPSNMPIAYADDAVEIIEISSGFQIFFYGKDPQKLPPTPYSDIERTGQYMMKVWGGSYLSVDDQICFSLVNTTDDSIGLPTDYDLEVKVNGQWYRLFREASTLAGALYLAPGENWTNSVRAEIRSKLHPGKYRIVSTYTDYDANRRVDKVQDYVEFEILEPGSSLPEKPTSYDRQFLNGFYHIDEPGLEAIKIENQPITTADEYLNFTIDMEMNDTAYWQRLHFETKIDGKWYLLGIYFPSKYPSGGNPQQYYVSYPSHPFYEPLELTLDKVSIPRIWAPAGPFAGEHRIRGELVLDEWTTALDDGSSITQYDVRHVSAEFKIVDAAEAGINTASAWAQETIASAISANLVPPSLQVKFQQPITRAEFAALAKTFLEAKTSLSVETLLGQKNITAEEGVFSDTNDANVLAAHSLGIVTGKGDGLFAPDGFITREQMAAMLMRTQAVLDSDIAASAPAEYTDKDQFSPWAVPGIDYVSEQGIMSGIGDNRFDPQGNCTREQAIVTFYRMLSKNN